MERPESFQPTFRRLCPVMLLLMVSIGTTRADVALLRNGRTLSVTDYRKEGDRIRLLMEGGGEIALPNEQVVAIRHEAGPALPSVTETTPAATDPLPSQALLSAPEPPALAAPAQRIEADGPMEIAPGAVFDRGALRDLAARIARKHRVDEALVLAVIEVESRYDAFAVSPRGAMGLMQLMPQTAARFAVHNVFNPVENVDGGVRYLKELLARYSGQVRLALAAYNAGEDAVDQFKGIPPFRETQQYVVRVLKALPR
jgi:soluble lytic murein transglycosylase-like protein